MNTLQQEYNLIKEGKGNKTQFLKNAKFQFPNLFNTFTSYEDSVNTLKSKGLISEAGVGGIVTGGVDQDWIKIFKQNIAEEVKAEEKKTSPEVKDIQAHAFDYKDQKNIDTVYGQAFLHGFYAEMQDPKNEEKTTNEVKEIVSKNLHKDPLYYTKDGMFGLKGVGYTTEAPGLGTPKEPKGKYKSSGYGDLREGMQDSESNKIVPPKPLTQDEYTKLTSDKKREKSPAEMAMVRGLEPYTKKLREIIRELITQELREDSNPLATAEKTVLQKKAELAAAMKVAADAAQKEVTAQKNP
jgi:hypothetical protein